MPRDYGTNESRFWPKVLIREGCWEWQAGRNRGGYGKFCYDGRCISASRAAWLLERGTIPDGMQVCHHCDNPLCVNPEHLFLGTAQDNMDDRYSKGRYAKAIAAITNNARRARGVRHGLAKFTEEQVRAIRARSAAGESAESIARSAGVTPRCILMMVRRETWAHVA